MHKYQTISFVSALNSKSEKSPSETIQTWNKIEDREWKDLEAITKIITQKWEVQFLQKE